MHYFIFLDGWSHFHLAFKISDQQLQSLSILFKKYLVHCQDTYVLCQKQDCMSYNFLKQYLGFLIIFSGLHIHKWLCQSFPHSSLVALARLGSVEKHLNIRAWVTVFLLYTTAVKLAYMS